MGFSVAAEDKSETAVVLAALVLFDADAPVSAENISKLITAAKIDGVEPYWSKLYADLLVGKDIFTLLATSGGSAPAAGPAVVEAKKEAKKEEAKKSSSSSEAMGGGFDLFGGDD